MIRCKIYYAEAQIVWAKQRDKNCSFLCVFDKETAKKIAQDFKELGIVKFEKSKDKEGEYTLFAKEWNPQANTEKGLYKMRLRIREGNERYPDPEVTIEDKQMLFKKETEDDIVGTLDCTTPAQPNTAAPTAAPNSAAIIGGKVNELDLIDAKNEDIDFPY